MGRADREAACAACLQDLRYLQNQADNLVVVMNEVFADGIRYEEGTMQYLRLLGALNSAAARQADAAYEVVYGIPVSLLGGTLAAAAVCDRAYDDKESV